MPVKSGEWQLAPSYKICVSSLMGELTEEILDQSSAGKNLQ